MRTLLLIGLAASVVCRVCAQTGPTFDTKRVVSHGPDDMPVAETAVAADPNDSDNVVAMWNIYNESGGRVWMGYAVSCDGGATWDDRNANGDLLLFPVPGGTCNDESGHADPGVVFNPNPSPAQGEPNVVASGLAPCDGVPSVRVVVCEMFAGNGDVCGDEFGSPEKLNEGNYTSCFTDFPHIAAGQLGEAWALHVVGWKRAVDPCQPFTNILQFYRLTDWGQGWSDRESIEVTENQQLVEVEGSYAVAGCGASDGRLYVGYTHKAASEPLKLHMVRSDDGGATWARTQLAQAYEFSGVPDDHLPSSITYLPQMLGVGVDPEDSDIVYVVYNDLAEAVGQGQDGDLNVYLVWSDDGGDTWSSRIRINNPGTPDDDVEKDQLYPCIAVDPEGRAHVFWYDNRDDPEGPNDDAIFDLYYARVDGGTVTDETEAVDEAIDTNWLINTSLTKLGEYIMAAPMPDGAICVFMGTSHPRIGFNEFSSHPTDETIFAKRVHWSQ